MDQLSLGFLALAVFLGYLAGIWTGVYYVCRPLRRPRAPAPTVYRSQLPTLTGIRVPAELLRQCRQSDPKP